MNARSKAGLDFTSSYLRRGVASVVTVALSLTCMVPSAYAQNDSVLNSISDSGVTVISNGKVVTDNTVVSAAESLAQQRAAGETGTDATGTVTTTDTAGTNGTTGSFSGDGNAVFANDNVFDSSNGLASGAKTVQVNDASDASDTGSDAADADAPSSDTPSDTPNAQADASDSLGGRDFAGQVTKTINGKTYILIGNEQQLRAIGTGKKVIGRVMKVTQTCVSNKFLDSEWQDTSAATVEYEGDADLATGATLRDKDANDNDSPLLACTALTINQKRVKYYGIADDGSLSDVKTANTGQTYTNTANYIIFRNIDLSSADWTPLMFAGVILGAIAAKPNVTSDLWNSISTDDVSVVADTIRPTISHVVVNQPAGKLNVSEQQGIGFFASLASKSSVTATSLKSAGTVVVDNIHLDDVSVTNNATEAATEFSLVQTLLTAVTAALKLLGLDLDGLLGAVRKDPTNFATGAFAGRVYGDVIIRNSNVSDVAVSNVKAMTGGFVGSMKGDTRYEVLSKVLGTILDTLADLLNLIPFLGLGDLVTFLEGLLGLDQLIPVGYYNPTIVNSSVTNFKNGVTLGNDTSKYAGGFAGYMEGAVITGSSVSSTEPFSVKALSYAGGFAGLARNGEIGGLLNNLGVELLAVLKPQSLVATSTMDAKGVTVTATKYVGGFVGATAASYVVNDSIGGTLNGPVAVEATDSYAGGFVGYASLGWGLELGTDVDDGGSSSGSSSLVGNLSKVVKNLLEGSWLGNANAGDLLSLVGVFPSHMLGVQITSNGMTVTAGKSYAGGVLGTGSGTIIAESSATNLKQISFWKHGTAPVSIEERNVTVEGLKSVSARTSYAGGVAALLQPATVASLLGNTLGLTDISKWLGKDDEFASFLLSNITVTGVDDTTGLTVSAGEDYAGGVLGCGTGGTATNVNLTKLGKVVAQGKAGGFAGFTGPGSAVGAKGVNLLGLIKISGLLSVAQYSSVTVKASNVTGITSGYTVQATGSGSKTGTYPAGGFYGQANSTTTVDSHVRQLKSVTADTTTADGVAGGFVGMSTTGGLAEAVDGLGNNSVLGDLISVNNLLGAVPYLLPVYIKTDVSYVNGGYVEADVAGGYAGDFQGGYVNRLTSVMQNDKDHVAEYEAGIAAAKASPVAVINIDHVTGGAYAGGFGGKVRSGALASAGEGGLSVLGKLNGVNIAGLLELATAYVPYVLYAGVQSDKTTFEAAGGIVDKNADYGLVVEARQLRDGDSNSGSAGGFAGYVSAAQISTSSVTQLRHTTVTAPKNLETTDDNAISDTYLNDDKSSYAVDAARYAGGYIGRVDLGSAAGVGKSINILGGTINLTDLVSALNVIVSTIEESDVTGGVGGYSVRASTADHKKSDGKTADPLGSAGGFVGDLEGGHIQHSNAHEFVYIIGQVAAGGYAGIIQPGVAADVLGDGTVLKTLLNVDGTLSLFQDFVPTIRNSSTDAAICGGAVRAQASSDSTTRRGMAGGYVGRDRGGQIWGNSTDGWSSISGKTADGIAKDWQRIAYAARIRSVYGQEIAGGYTGLMEAADTAEGGSLSVLGGLIKADNIAGALSVVYPTERHAKVTGPLRNASYDQWQTWVENIGKYGAYGKEFTNVAKAGADKVTDRDTLNAFLEDYVFGFNVVAGRGVFANAADEIKTCRDDAEQNAKPEDKDAAKAKCYELGANLRDSGVAGGHVGLMRTGTITDGQSEDVRNVIAMRAAGGYAGTMESGTAATFGSVNILGLKLDLGQLLNVASVFVPVVKSSSVIGYRRGMRVSATGSDITHGTGNAGGYVGLAVGAQIWGDRDVNGDELAKNAAANTAAGANVKNLRKVSGRNNVGGFVGAATSGSIADVDTNAASGFLSKVLDTVIGTPASLLQVLQATIVTIRGAYVSPDSNSWGYTVEGAYQDANGNTQYALNAGGFAGSLQAAILGDKDSAKGTGTTVDTANDPAALTVSGLRAVEGGQYAGGFFGLADVSSVVSVGGGQAAGDNNDTNVLLKLLSLGKVGVLEAFRTFVYDGQVAGVADGIQIKAHTSSRSGMLDKTRFTGAAGGFGGGLINGSVKKSGVTKLNSVTGLNYTGGFIGHLGKSGTVSADKVSLADSKLLGLTAGVLDIWGSHIEDSTVSGISAGYTVTSTHNGVEYGKTEPITSSDDRKGMEIAGGFAGYSDLARMSRCTATGLKKVSSSEMAGGFTGRTSYAYLVDTGVNSELVDALIKYLINPLLKILYVSDAENLGNKVADWKKQNLGWLTQLIDLDILANGNLIYINLLGLKISVGLDKNNTPNDDSDDTAIIEIGDSKITVKCSEEGIDPNEVNNIKVQLVRANRTKIANSKVQGIADGYDVFGGGATQDKDGDTDLKTGYAGGFVGWNDHGLMEVNDMTYADTIRGTAGLVGPFSGALNSESNWNFNDAYDLEGNNNTYHIYRDVPSTWSYALTADRKQFTYGSHMDNVTKDGQAIDVTGALRLPLNRYDVAHLANEQDQWGKPVVVPYIQKFADYKGAVMSNNPDGVNDEDENGKYKSESLGVYVSAAQADLMLGKATADNNGGITPEPDDGQDACGLEGCGDVSLTLRKVWRDNAKNRPQGITVVLTAAYTNKNGEKITPVSIQCSDSDCKESAQPNPRTVTMTAAANASAWSNTWRMTIDGLPVGFLDTEEPNDGDTNGTFRYYTYTVQEATLIYSNGKSSTEKTPDEAGYSVATSYAIEYDPSDKGTDTNGTGKEYVATITNYIPGLPNTGGAGTQWIMMLAVIILGLGTAWYLHDTGKTSTRRKRGKHHA